MNQSRLPRVRAFAGTTKEGGLNLYFGLAFVLATLLCATPAGAATLAQWTQFRADGALEARALTEEASCPAYGADKLPAAERAAPDANFPLRVCTALLPKPAEPRRIVVIGDTGCRLKDMEVQACINPDAWPFAQIAAAAATSTPDLVIHVGDYLYRESPCPARFAACTGSPHGDNWPTWNADFFAPAAPLLAAAPWLMVRGNHEICGRAGTGWTRLLGPELLVRDRPCTKHLPPFAVTLGTLTLVAFDDGIAPDDPPGDAALTPLFVADFAAAGSLAQGTTWYVMHRPLRAVMNRLGHVGGGNYTMLPAVREGLPANVELLLSGHIHVFEALDFESGPPQLIAGNGGDNLDTAPSDLAGIESGGLRIASGWSLPGFGFLLLTRDGAAWRAEAYDKAGKLLLPCRLEAKRLDCAKA